MSRRAAEATEGDHDAGIPAPLHFLAYKRIAFKDEVITASANGRVVCVEARGDFETLHTRPYRNVYLITLVFDDAGTITVIEEWTNPVTASMTWEFPLGPLPCRVLPPPDSPLQSVWPPAHVHSSAMVGPGGEGRVAASSQVRE